MIHEIVQAVSVDLLGKLVTLAVAAALTVALSYLKNNPKDVQYATIGLTLVQDALKTRLGPKSDAVIAAWTAALSNAQKTTVGHDQAVDEFVAFVKAVASAQNVNLTPIELNAVHDAAEITIRMVKVKRQPTAQAVKIMSTQ